MSVIVSLLALGFLMLVAYRGYSVILFAPVVDEPETVDAHALASVFVVIAVYDLDPAPIL